MRTSYTIFSTVHNHYLYSQYNNQFLLLHPLLYYVLLQKENGIDLNSWIKTVDHKIKIENMGTFTKKEILYQYDKFLFLQKNHYFETNKYEINQYTADDIKYFFSNTRSLTFEVTEDCNLSCDYCVYGKYYTTKRTNQRRTLDIEVAKNTLNFVFSHWESSLNSSHDKRLSIGFYGGEPLLNFDFVKKIVAFVKERPSYRESDIDFTMTTNGVLLNKHITFLVENNFSIKVSLDGGTAQNNSYRKFHDGSVAFDKIYKNILYIKDKYPDFFKRNIEFISVLHNRNSYSDLSDFFLSTFDKKANISELATDSLNPENENEFWKMFQEVDNLAKECNSVECKQIKSDIESIIRFIRNYGGYTKSTYSELIKKNRNSSFSLTGTCQPFIRMIFVTADGKILPCERISHQYSLGHANTTTVEVNFDKIADKLNGYLNNAYATCEKCIFKLKCEQCLLQTEIASENLNCRKFIENSDFEIAKFLSENIAILEKHPYIYLLSTKYKLI